MAEPITIYDTAGHGTGKCQAVSWKADQPRFTYVNRENHLVERVEQARSLGVSYGQYMAMLKDGLYDDPLMREEDE